MKPLINWIRTNPILLVAAILCVSSLGALVFVHFQGESFKSEMKSREGKIDEIQRFKKTQITLPGERVDSPPRTETTTVTPTVIKVISEVYRQMDEEYKSIFTKAVDFNRGAPPRAHDPVQEGIFPEAGDRPYLLFAAKTNYRQAVAAMMKPYSRDAMYPGLNAGGPANLNLLSEDLQRVTDEYLTAGVVTRTVDQLSDEEYEELQKRRTVRLMDTLRRQASKIHIYAESDPKSADFPFEMGEWSTRTQPPHVAEVWEGQMGLWLTQDVVQAIAVTNSVSNPDSNVVVAPIKRLLKIQVGNRYVGVDLTTNITTALSGGTPTPPAAPEGGVNHALSPTGRVSNEIYDVRHIRVEMIVDWKRINEFINHLATTNLMTVLQINVEDVDEYEALRQGYVYGVGDAVKVDMIIESLWLRDWTARIMPKLIKQGLGIPIEQPAAAGSSGVN